MRKREVKYRLEVDYYSKDYDDRMCSTSGPIYSLKEGWKQYRAAIKETCIDDKSRPARVWFWKYNYTDGRFDPITLAKNY